MERLMKDGRRGSVIALIVLTLAAAFCVALLIPNAASAGTWKVYRNGGALAGKVTTNPYGGFFVYYGPNWGANDIDYGGITAGDGGSVMMSEGLLLGSVHRRSATSAVFLNTHAKVVGRARLVGQRWVLSYLKDGNFRTRGYVTKACPGSAAVGALRVLVCRHKL